MLSPAVRRYTAGGADQPRDERGRFAEQEGRSGDAPTRKKAVRPATHASIGELVDAATRATHGTTMRAHFHAITADLSKRIYQETGVSIVPGTVCSLDDSVVRHILSRHGEGNEWREGQVPVLREDIETLPNVVEHPDAIRHETAEPGAPAALIFEKRIGGTLVAVFAHRPQRQELAVQSMRKFRK